MNCGYGSRWLLRRSSAFAIVNVAHCTIEIASMIGSMTMILSQDLVKFSIFFFSTVAGLGLSSGATKLLWALICRYSEIAFAVCVRYPDGALPRGWRALEALKQWDKT